MGLTKGAFKRLITPGSGSIVQSTDHRIEAARLVKNPVRKSNHKMVMAQSKKT